MSTSGMGGSGKSANVELNLVPFIDLLSTLICFLLVTAAWQELESMKSNAPPKSMSESPNDQPPPPVPDKKKVMLIVALTTTTIELSEDEKSTTINNVAGEPDFTKLIEKLRDWKTRYPDRKDVTLATDNSAKYKYLIKMMDTLIAEQFPDVGINL